MSVDGSGDSAERVVARGVLANAWSSDGTAIAFQRDGDAYIDIWVTYLDGSPERRLTTDPNFDGGADGRVIDAAPVSP